MKRGVSIIIGARNEFPQIAMTIGNLMEDCVNSGVDYEIILMDNGSTDETSRFFSWKPIEKGRFWKYEYSPRGLVAEGKLRIFFDPVMSNVGTRNKGVLHSRYDTVLFSDAHIIVRPGTVKYMVETANKYGGIIHAPVSWLGSSGENPSPGYQYSYKVGEKIYGTWNKIKVADTPFYIPFCGHCFITIKRDEFIKYGGYPYSQRVYGGGEPYLDTKWWMVGSHSMCDPRALVYHLSAGRGYNWHNDDLIHNMFLVSYILGGIRWADRVLITYLNKTGINVENLMDIYNEAILEGEKEYKWLLENKKYDFEQVLALDTPNNCEKCTKRGFKEPHAMRLWDIKNEELHNYHRSYVQHFTLTRDFKGDVFIGNTRIITKEALSISNKYI